ncbi:hypothetical protein LF1_40120 [Rubripirellula obstinata]|uniref:DUF3140 domain-containing protein n=1 Tax=Rubripirellula obstinata TaxID=406547 RepID=A0A5B1CMA1_9BACT|nr:DUF3140 domain-containing protein [Rubripirellula obstinata]KAA1261462.1 hypothetical protein LF1_40120 [Rubripirellula obstinata]
MTGILNDTQEETYQQFKELVNMQPQELADWLETDQSKSVGHVRDGEDESVGHQSGEIADTDWCYSLKNWGHDPTP